MSSYRIGGSTRRGHALWLRTPEDIFAGAEDVADRHHSEIRSPAIDRAIEDWNTAKAEGDDHGLRAAARAIVDATSATFRQQGVPTFAHPVLPPQFAKAVMKDVDHLPAEHQRSSVRMLSNIFEPGAKMAAEQEFASHLEDLRHVPRDATQLQSSQSAPQIPSSPLGLPSVPSGGWASTSRRQQSSRYAEGPFWRQQELLPPDDGGEDGLRPEPSPTGPFARPKPDKPPVPGFEYGAWEKKPDPRTGNGSLLVPPNRLSKRQQDNLLRRNWIHPTGKPSGAARLDEGYGYFGADRSGPGNTTVHHGAYDAPYRYKRDPDYDLEGNPITYSRAVRLPTRATYLGFVPTIQNDPVYGRRTINMFQFSLGDGIILEMLHVEMSPAFRAKLAAANRTGAPLEFDAGEVLGEIDADHDHTHIQIRVTGPNGEKWVVDPTYFFEKKARTFLRMPLPDALDDAIDWTVRQFE